MEEEDRGPPYQCLVVAALATYTNKTTSSSLVSHYRLAPFFRDLQPYNNAELALPFPRRSCINGLKIYSSIACQLGCDDHADLLVHQPPQLCVTAPKLKEAAENDDDKECIHFILTLEPAYNVVYWLSCLWWWYCVLFYRIGLWEQMPTKDKRLSKAMHCLKTWYRTSKKAFVDWFFFRDARSGVMILY